MMALTTASLVILLLVVLVVWMIVFVKIDDAVMARSMPSSTSDTRRYRPFGGAREIARRARQLERGIIRAN